MSPARTAVAVVAGIAGLASLALPSCKSPNPLPATSARDSPSSIQRAQLLALVDGLERLFQERYAPAAYKRDTLHWEVRTEAARLRERFLQDPLPDAAELRRLLYRFFRSPSDIHTSIRFDHSRAVWLGLHMKRVEGVYRVAWLDRAVLAIERSPIELGDEVLSLDEVPIDRVVEQTKAAILYRSTPAFEQAFAEWMSFFRATDEWGEIPSAGSQARLKIRRGGQALGVSLPWRDDEVTPPSQRCPFWGKTKAGYLPLLGHVVWSSPAGEQFPAYVFEAGGQSYGYLRFYTWEVEPQRQLDAVKEINRAVDEFQRRRVRAVVLDQLGNGGGDFLLGATLLSRFVTTPLHLPRQQYLIASDGFVPAVGTRAAIERYAAKLQRLHTDADAAQLMDTEPLFTGALSFLPRTLTSIRSVSGFLQFFLEQPTGTLTPPHAELQEAIVPDPSLGPAFTGPLLLLNDEETISAPEFLAAALIDNGRAVGFGTRTAGAGGDQRWFSPEHVCPEGKDRDQSLFSGCLPQDLATTLRSLGVKGFGITATLGVRVLGDGTLGPRIENQGVDPQIAYQVTEGDLRDSFRPMAERIVEVLRGL